MAAQQFPLVQIRVSRRRSLSWSGPAKVQAGDWRGALLAARRRLKNDPDDLSGLEVLARALVALGAPDEALSVLRHLIRLNPHEPAYDLWRSSALQAKGRYSEALVSLSRAYSLYKVGPVKDRVLEELELLISFLELSGHTPVALWSQVGITPPVRRKGNREAIPLIN